MPQWRPGAAAYQQGRLSERRLRPPVHVVSTACTVHSIEVWSHHSPSPQTRDPRTASKAATRSRVEEQVPLHPTEGRAQVRPSDAPQARRTPRESARPDACCRRLRHACRGLKPCPIGGASHTTLELGQRCELARRGSSPKSPQSADRCPLIRDRGPGRGRTPSPVTAPTRSTSHPRRDYTAPETLVQPLGRRQTWVGHQSPRTLSG